MTKYVATLVGGLCLLGCGGDDKSTADGENTAARCEDGVDNDADGAVDCDDAECTGLPPCDHVDAWHRRAGRRAAVDPGQYVVETARDGSFALVSEDGAAPLVVASNDFEGVIRAAGDLQTDIARVTEVEPELVDEVESASGSRVVLIGTIGQSTFIDGLVKSGKLDVSEVQGKWETFVITEVDSPMAGIDSALVIAGSDQRGTIFGIYDLSAQMGISPWHFWDDVPPQKKDELYVLEGRHSQGEPAVKYRGIFINDENPALDRWHRITYPSEGYPFKKEFYTKIYEVMLRLKANYLWPAVWGRAFAEDDPENHATAKRYGIVMGTSHEAPMMRGIEEWNRHATDGSDPYGGNGEWSYRTNPDALETYWQEGIQRMVDEDFEGIVTVGMRGPGDVALAPEDGIPLVNDFIGAQRDIIQEVTGQDPARQPQLWALYKEVQEWWEEGLRVPDDVTVMFCDDNWGNLRMLPDPSEPERSGGYGLYYHFDYVGGPRNYKWVDTNLLPNIWEQLHLAYERGVDRVWMVNVGDLKNNELPTQFFMDYAWNPERWPVERLGEWEERYAAQQFGPDLADAIAAVLHRYSTLQSDRKPELLNVWGNATTCPFSLTNYREMEQVVEQWLGLASDVEAIGSQLSEELQDAYYQLVLYPVKASSLMYELRLAGFKNLLYVEQGRAAANALATVAEEKFSESKAMRDYYNKELADGKWNGFQSQPYLGYSSWQQPESGGNARADFIYPELQALEVPEGVDMGVAIDGSTHVWPEPASDTDTGSDSEALPGPVLPTFSPYQTQPAQYIEVFRRGTAPFDYQIAVTPEVDWLTITPHQGTLDESTPEVRSDLQVTDWSSVPEGTTNLTVTVTNLQDGTTVEVAAIVERPSATPKDGAFVESNGYISIEADDASSRVVDTESIQWQRIADIGRTGSGMTPFPVTAERQSPGGDSPRLEYDLHLFSTGAITVWAYLSPRQNVLPSDGPKVGISLDEGEPEIVDIPKTLNCLAYPPDKPGWQKGVADNVHRIPVSFEVEEAGSHVLKVWMVDPTVIVQKIVVDAGGMLSSYLGPPPSLVAGMDD